MEAVLKNVRVEAEMPRPATREELARFQAPTLVIAGEKDAMFPGEAVVRRAKEIIPNLVAAECLTGATHLCSPADMAHINRRIAEFLASAACFAGLTTVAGAEDEPLFRRRGLTLIGGPIELVGVHVALVLAQHDGEIVVLHDG